jgi:hypothetical protein
MKSGLDVGYVAPAGQDVLPTTGPHLDVRVLKEGKYIDPGTIRSLLTKLKVGKDKKPLWQQKGEQWSPTFQITSGFGARKAPVAGASTYHLAHDYGIGGGTPLTWEGAGTFEPGKGYGTIKTTDEQGTPYEIKLLHTKGGKASTASAAPTTPPQETVTKSGDTYIFVPGNRKGKASTSDDFLASYMQQMLTGNTTQIQSSFDPVSMLTQAFSQTPNYLT